jgi:hypothetical protein
MEENKSLEIPISVAESIANDMNYDEVVIFAANHTTGRQHVTTFGKSVYASASAAQGGNAIKKLLGWPEDQCHAKSSKQTEVSAINEAIKNVDSNLISDGYHTFGELYEHRIVNYIMVCQMFNALLREIWKEKDYVWMSMKHSDGTQWEGWFILGIFLESGKQITYHLPISRWEQCASFARLLPQAPAYDGHTSNDVLERLQYMFKYENK